MADAHPNKPPSIYQRGKIWWYNKLVGGRRLRRSLRTTDLNTAILVYQAKYDAGFPEDNLWKFSNSWVRDRLDGARERSKKRGMPCHLSRQDILDLVERAAGRCELTGVLFHQPVNRTSRRNPWAPTIDRIDSSKPYSKENCRLVCYAINTAISEWGEATFRTMVSGYLGCLSEESVTNQK